MANIQSLYIIKAEDGTVVNAESDYDLSVEVDGKEFPKEVAAAYILDNGDGTFSEYNYNANGSKYVTKVTNPTSGQFAYLDEMSGEVSDLLTNPSCGACSNESKPVTPVEVETSCEKPLFVKVCNDYDGQTLIVTEPIPICAKVCEGDKTDLECGVVVCVYLQWLVREEIVWDTINSLEVSRKTVYSTDGKLWTDTAPENTVFGECPTPSDEEFTDCNPSISEAFADNLSTLGFGHNFLITKPACCKILVQTSVGSFHIKSGVQSYNSSDFGCLVEIQNISIVEGSCSLNQIQVITNKIK